MTTEEISSHLTSLIHEISHATNIRNLDITLPPWSENFSPSFRVSTGVLTSPEGDDLAQFLKDMRGLCDQNPGFRHVVKEAKAMVNARKTRAEVLMNVDFEGLPIGIVRPGVASAEWKLEGEKWLCTRWTSFRGLGGDGGVPGMGV